MKLIIVLLWLSLVPAGAGSSATDISGTWALVVDPGGSNSTTSTITFKQEGKKLSGTFSRGPGERQVVAGMVKGDKVAFRIYFRYEDKPDVTVSYTGTVESPTKMTGAIEPVGGAAVYKWTATKKKK